MGNSWNMTPGAPGSYSGTDSSGRKMGFTLDSNGNYTGYRDDGTRVTVKISPYGNTWQQIPSSPPSSQSYSSPSYSTPSSGYSGSSGYSDGGGSWLKKVVFWGALIIGVPWAYHHPAEVSNFIDGVLSTRQTGGPSVAPALAPAPAIEEPKEPSAKVDFPEPAQEIDQELARLNTLMHGQTPSPLPTQKETDLAALYKQEAENNDIVAMDDAYASCQLTPKGRALCVPVDGEGKATGQEPFVISRADLRRARYVTVEQEWEDRHAQQTTQ